MTREEDMREVDIVHLAVVSTRHGVNHAYFASICCDASYIVFCSLFCEAGPGFYCKCTHRLHADSCATRVFADHRM